MTATQQQKARRFHDLHRGERILVLPNAWDAASARIFELAGARAVATTSAGVANAQGFPDGEKIPIDLVLLVARRICESVDVPVTVDLEAGYGSTGAEIAANVAAVLESGAVGVNLEDAMLDPAVLVEKIGAALDASRRKDVPLFVNARTDVYLGGGKPEQQFDEAVCRLRRYEDTGAHGLFVPGLYDAQTIGRLLPEIHRPLNVMAFDGVPSPKELERLGVARVSMGAGPMRATMGLVRRMAADLLAGDSYASFTADAIPHGEANAMFSDVRR